MIIKSLSRKNNAAQLVKYVLRYSLKENRAMKDKEHATIILRHNLRSRSLNGYVKEFRENEMYRIYHRKDAVILFHNILSLHPSDKQKISDAILKDFAKKFVELRARDCLCLAVAHKEKEHTHIHLINSGVKIDGYSARISKQNFKTIIRTLETYQREKYPELIYSKNNHESVHAKTKEEIVASIKATRQTTKLSLIEELEKTFHDSRTYSEFLDILRKSKYEIYNRNDKPTGLVVDGKKFRFSRLGFDSEKLEQLQSKEQHKQLQVTQLQTIRERSQKVQDKDRHTAKNIEQINIKLPSNELVKEIQSIRTRIRTSDKEEPGIERSIIPDIRRSIDDTSIGTNQPSLFDADIPEFVLHENVECI